MKIIKFKSKQKYKYKRKVIIKDLILKIFVGIHDYEKDKKKTEMVNDNNNNILNGSNDDFDFTSSIDILNISETLKLLIFSCLW